MLLLASLTALSALVSAQSHLPSLEHAYDFSVVWGNNQSAFNVTQGGTQELTAYPGASYSGSFFNASSTAPALGYGTLNADGTLTFGTRVYGQVSDGTVFSIEESGLVSNSSHSRHIWTVASSSTAARLSSSYILCQGAQTATQLSGSCYFVNS